MRFFRLLWEREVQELWQRPLYWITTGIMVVLVSLVFLIGPIWAHQLTTLAWSLSAPNHGQTVLLRQAVQHAAYAEHLSIHWVNPRQAAVVIRIMPSALFAQHIIVRIVHNPSPTRAWIVHTLMPSILSERLSHVPHMMTLWQHLIQPPAVMWNRLPSAAPGPPAGQVGISLSLVMIVFLMLALYGQMIMYSVSTEKVSRLSELLSVHISPSALLLSKWIGVGTAAMVQIVIIVATAGGYMTFDPAARIFIHTWHLQYASWWLWATMGAAFVSGYGIYGTLFLSLGASLSRPEDARSATGLPALGMVMSYAAVFYVMNHPVSGLAHDLTVIPPFFPFLILLDEGLNTATTVEWVLGGALTALSIVGLFLWASGQYRLTLYHTPTKQRLRFWKH